MVMNGRIKQLAAEVGISVEYLNNTKQWVLIEALAERIVEEMYDFMCKATDNDGAWPSSKEVKQHFGVDGMSTEDKKTLIKELLGVKNERTN
jgi:hypothetical protein